VTFQKKAVTVSDTLAPAGSKPLDGEADMKAAGAALHTMRVLPGLDSVAGK
jgi:hypothetical protein